LEEGKGTPEMTRLLGPSMRRASNTPGSPVMMMAAAPYHQQGTIRHQMNTHPRTERFPSHSSVNDGASINTFGTLQRGVNRADYGGSHSPQMAYGSRSPKQNHIYHQDSYASIRKAHHNGSSGVLTHSDLVERRASNDNYPVANNTSYSNANTMMYATYGRHAQHRPPPTPNGAHPAANYASYNGSIVNARQSAEPTTGVTSMLVNGVKDSPLASDRRMNHATIAYREQSPYQRASPTKLTSFNGNGEKQPYGQIFADDQWDGIMQPSHQQQHEVAQQQRPAVIPISAQKQLPVAQQMSNGTGAQWSVGNNYTKLGTISASSSQQEGSQFTSSSTMTSQGSSNYSTQEHTPVAGSPTANNPLYDNADMTLTRSTPTATKANNLSASSHSAGGNGTASILRQQQPPPSLLKSTAMNGTSPTYGAYNGELKFNRTKNEFATSVV
jgi:hypothetical protein